MARPDLATDQHSEPGSNTGPDPLLVSTPATADPASCRGSGVPSDLALALAVGLGALLVVPAALVQPVSVHDAGPGSSAAQLQAAQDWVGGHTTSFHLTNLLIALGLFSLAWFVRGVGRRVAARRRARLATAGSMLAATGLVAAAVANAVISTVRVVLVEPVLDRGQALTTYVAVIDHWYVTPFFAPYLVLVPLGTLLLLIATVRSRVMPWWSAVLGLGFIAAIPFSPPATSAGVLLGGLLLVWMLHRRTAPRGRQD